MFRSIMWTHVRWTRPLVALMSIMAFLTPAMAWFVGGTRVERSASPVAIIAGFDSAAPMLAAIAMLGAFVLAAYPWSIDSQTRHVQALSLPMPWRTYVAMRFGAGALLLLIPAFALWLGSLLAISLVTLPPTLRAYPGTLAIRFLAASLLAYAMTFTLQYLSGRKSAVTLLGIIATVAIIWMGITVTGNRALTATIMNLLVDFPGPFAVFAAEWKLIDV